VLTRRNLLGSLLAAPLACLPKSEPTMTAGAILKMCAAIKPIELKAASLTGSFYMTQELLDDREAVKPIYDSMLRDAMKEAFGVDYVQPNP
jgi:hypothetical protein